MNKYNIIQLVEYFAYPNNVKFLNGQDESSKIVNDLGQYLAQGYEIYKAIMFNTRDVVGIKYILRIEL